MGSHPPLGQRHLRALKQGANRYGELAFAIVAIVQAGTVRLLLTFHLGDFVLIGVATVRAKGTVRPAQCLKRFPGLVLVLKHLGFECGHGFAPLTAFIGRGVTFVKYIIPLQGRVKSGAPYPAASCFSRSCSTW